MGNIAMVLIPEIERLKENGRSYIKIRRLIEATCSGYHKHIAHVGYGIVDLMDITEFGIAKSSRTKE